MKVIVVDKNPILKMCRVFFGLEFGMVDFDDTIHILCLGIRGDKTDHDHIRDMVYNDRWFQGHHEPYTNDQKMRLFRFFLNLRGHIVSQVHERGNVSYHMHIRYLDEKTSAMSVKFEVCE